MSIPRFLGRAGLARYLGVSVTRIGQLNIPPDAKADDRPLWSPATAARLRIEHETRRAERLAARGKRACPAQTGEAAA